MIRMLLSALLVSILSGCMALPVAMMAASYGMIGFSSYKLFQTATGGAVKVGFDEKSFSTESRQALADLRKVAIWPGTEGEVRFAEVLQAGGKVGVVSPATVQTAMRKRNLPDKIDLLTSGELAGTFQTICEDTGADGLVAFRITGSSANMNVVSLDRANQTVNFQMLVYSRAKRAIVATQGGGVVVEVGSSNVSTPEILRIAGEASAGKFAELAR